MNLHISPKGLVSEIQKQFNEAFPFLKLEFFNKKSMSAGFSANQIVSPAKKIGEVQLAVTDGDLEISDGMRVNELENVLKAKFGLIAHVLRRSGNLWLETTITGNWTLLQQNSHGREITTG